MKPRVLVAHPYLNPSGGGNSVAAWALQALRDEYDVTLGALGGTDVSAVNRSFGTSLSAGDFEIRIAPVFWRGLVRSVPTSGALVEQHLTMRWARSLDRSHRFDMVMSTQNEADLGRPGLQYVHFPWAYLPRPEVEMRWFHRIPRLLAAYRASCRWIGQTSDAGLRNNLSLANSEYVADRIRDVHGVESKILYPPVAGGFPDIPWDQRITGVACLGRMHSYKRWAMAVDIVDQVRQRGIDLKLTLMSHRDDLEYGAEMEALAAQRPWFRILYDLPRSEMVREVARHRYGLHAMEEEHFGIAPAELQRAGCITFVHRSGGPMEIVGQREELMSRNSAEACERIFRAIQESGHEAELRRCVAERADHYSAERFCAELREHVREAIGRQGK